MMLNILVLFIKINAVKKTDQFVAKKRSFYLTAYSDASKTRNQACRPDQPGSSLHPESFPGVMQNPAPESVLLYRYCAWYRVFSQHY
ncbi:hypothetical protein DSY0835 [Desulfitobacterium hafniense Y51]|uniref:Uncharacterized protein n=1 Tax=Desulfitobacterium hafniense (strain Y51) TaxID=138119 RepID=Q24ZB8_DESHY|nr:hypothetical protein DSY0835 [Desulfitobacterium hafniense Y51]